MSFVHVFDLGNVLLFFDYTPFFAKIAARCDETQNLPEIIFREYHRSDLARGGSFTDFHAGVSRALELDLTEREFAAAWSDIFRRNEAMIECVSQAPQPRFLLSNTDATHIAWIREQFPEILPLFDGVVLSFEARATKPDPIIYRQVERLSGARPEQHLFVDDMLENIVAAQACGWNALQFTSVAGYLRELAALTSGV